MLEQQSGKSPTKFGILLFTLLQLIALPAQGTIQTTLQGVGLSGTQTFNGINVSMAGGGDIAAYATDGLNSEPEYNYAYFKTSDLGSTVTRQGTPPTEDDAFQSAPDMGKLAYSHPPIGDLFNRDITAFEPYDRIDFTISFVDSATGNEIQCADSSKCLVRYSWSYTPLLRYMSPPVMYPGMIATAALNAQSTMSYKRDDEYAAEIRIDGESLAYEGYGTGTGTSLGSNSRVSGVQGSRQRNNDLHPEIKFFGAGYAREWHLSSAVCGPEATSYDDCYTAKVLPTIQSMSMTEGSSEGGQFLTIDGTSLDANSTVRILVDGVRCVVEDGAISESQINCTTQFKDLAGNSCSDPTDPICECSDPTDPSTCSVSSVCEDQSNPVCSCFELDGGKTCVFAPACADPSDNSCTCTDASDPSTCWFEPVCGDAANPACLCSDPYDDATCDFQPACLSDSQDYCVCDNLWNITTCKVQTCDDPDNFACECTCDDPTDSTTCYDCQYKAACTNTDYDDGCFCHDLYDYQTCSAVANCTDATLGVCTLCSDPLDINTCEQSPVCIDPVNQACTCTDVTNATSCSINAACLGGDDAVCPCSDPADLNTCYMEPACDDENSEFCECTTSTDTVTTTDPVTGATTTDTVTTVDCVFKAICLDKMDLSCTCDDYSDLSTCSMNDLTPEAQPECKDLNNPACRCYKPDDVDSCEYALACLDDEDTYCICTDLFDPSTCNINESRFIVGQQGLVRTYWPSADGVSIWNYPSHMSTGSSSVWTTLEIAHATYTDSVEAFQGYFRAPMTGRYRFLMSCDDNCALWFNKNQDSMNPARSTHERLLYRSSHTSFRNHYPELRNEASGSFGVQFSKWVDLQEGQYHHMHVAVGQASGDYHLSVGIELKPDAMPDVHPRKEKQIQRVGVWQTIENWEVTLIRINGGDLDRDAYKITMIAPDANSTQILSEPLTLNATAEEMQAAIEAYYQEYYSVTPVVAKYYEDVNGTVVATDDWVPADHYTVYNVTVRSPIGGPGSCTQGNRTMGYIGWSDANITFVESCREELGAQLVDPILQGSMYFTCFNTDGQSYVTSNSPISVCSSASAVESHLTTQCSFLKGKLSVAAVWRDIRYGCEYQLNFWNMDAEVGQFVLHSYGDPNFPDLLDPIIGLNLEYKAVERRPFGSVLIWEQIPAEWFYTSHSLPQVKMWVDDFPVLCATGNCNYEYQQRDPVVTGYSLTGTQLVIDGTDLPTTDVTVQMGYIPCEIDPATPATDTQIQCALSDTVPAGKWLPQIIDEYGIVRYDPSVSATVVTATVTSFSPADLRKAGGTLVTIIGTNFPPFEHPAYAGFKIYLGASTDGSELAEECTIVSYSSTELVCSSAPVSSSRRRRLSEGRNLAILVPVPEPTGEGSVTEGTDGPASEIVAGPDSATPVGGEEVVVGGETRVDPVSYTLNSVSDPTLSTRALTTIELCIDPAWTGMCDNDPPFEVSLVPTSLEISQMNQDYDPRPLRVVGCDESTGCIDVKYGGAYAGNYTWDIASTDPAIGKIDTAGEAFRAWVAVTEVVPTESSVLGGAELTLRGTGFQEALGDNIVKVGAQWWSGIDHYCYMTEVVSTEEVKCRLPLDLNREEKAYDVIYFMSTFEEGNQNCGTDGGEVCLHTFIPESEMPQMSGEPTVALNQATGQLEMVFAGTGIMGANGASVPEDMDIFVDGVKQEVLSISDSEIRVGLDSLPGGEGRRQVDLYFPKGIPGGYESYQDGVEITPELIGLSHNIAENGIIGSIGGSELEAVVPGVGPADEGRYSLATPDGTDICDSVTIEEYGKLRCNVTAGLEIPSGTELALRVDSGSISDCQALDVTDCNFETATAGAEPSISGITLSADGTEITFTGANFPTSGFTCEGSYAGAVASDCIIDSDGQARLVFAAGAPSFEEPGTAPLLRFVADDETIANNASGSTALANPLVINSVNGNSNLETSFAGGQTLNIAANGLAEKVALGEAVVRVCSRECEPDASLSDASNFACRVPAIATTQSNSLFQTAEEEHLRASSSSTPIENARQVIGGSDGEQLLDGRPLPAISGTSAGCNYGLKFASGLVGELNEFGIFLDYFDTTKVYDSLMFQASNDNFVSEIVDLVTMSSEAHEGWNYYDLVDLLGSAPKYNAYRIYNALSRGCDDIGEIALIGYEVIEDPADTHACDIEVVYTDADGAEVVASPPNGEQVVYRTDFTPIVTGVSNPNLDVEGGETITLTGSGFSGGGTAEVTIDGVACQSPTVVSDTEITCTTAPRLGDGNCAMDRSALDVFFTDKGKAVAHVTLRYVSLWSKSSTWGDLFPPVDGESISVPACRHLLMDIDASPKIYAIIVDGGSFIIPPDTNPDHRRALHAQYIMINNGLMEVGTEDNPYCSKLIITMYGSKYDPAMPIYGKKVIGVRFSTLDMHGCPVSPCWTQLQTTATAGTNTITTAVATDWKVGDVILLPSTSYHMSDAEMLTIETITSDADHSYITTTTNLKATHYGEIEEYGVDQEKIDLRGEIAVMSRSVIYRGDPETSEKNKFGAHIMVHSPGDETSIGRISNVQLEDVGQAFLLGKYPIHFHMIGRVTKSYIRCNTVNRSYNRGTTIHGVKYLTVADNTYYDCMGHTIFIEDAAETKNKIEHNLVVNTKASHSLLDTDTTPGCFWITHPDNIFRDNHAAGCEKYGFWFDLQTHSTGPSASNNICPTKSKLGEFTGNVAHTVGRYGLRIFHDHQPREQPCTGGAEVPAVYEDFTGYMNKRSGVMGLRLGAIVFKDIKVADNLNSGIQFDHVVTSDPEANYLESALIIGTSSNPAGGSTGHGIITPQTENWQVKSAHFFSFPTGAALGQCSHCFEVNMEDTDADTVRFAGLKFDDATVPRRIRWTTYRKGIFHDLDGSLTGLGPDTWATPLWEHNQWSETTGDMACTFDEAVYDGLICDNTVTVRKILFYDPSGGSISGRELKLWQWDAEYILGMTADELYLYYSSNDNATDVDFEAKKNPENHWTLPYVIPKGGKHTFYARWGYGHDFEGVRLARTASLWTEEDGEIEFIMPFYAIREAIYFDDNLGDRHVNRSWFNTEQKMCDNVVYNETFNETQPKNYTVLVNHAEPAISECKLTGIQCLNNCWDQIGDVEDLGDYDGPQLWSNVSTWPSGKLPVDGDDVVIETNMNVIMDIYETPKLGSLEVNGKLSCLQGQPCLIQVYNFWIRQGELEIGTAAEPFQSEAVIRLLGNNTQEYWAFTPQIDSGNKNLVVTGKAGLFGLPRDTRTILQETAFANDDEIRVEPGLDWVAGDYIGIITSNAQAFASESFRILSYDPGTGIAVLDGELENSHFGDRESTGKDFGGLDFRSEVVLFTRNVRIEASLDDVSYSLQDAWGCRVLVADFFERDWSHQKGHLELDYVEIFNCSQRETFKPALSFEYARGGVSSVTNSAIHHGQGFGVQVVKSREVTFSNNVVYSFFEKGLKVEDSFFVTVDDNLIGHIGHTWEDQFTYFTWFDFKGGAVALTQGNADLVVRNNVAFGANFYGFEYNALKCNDKAAPTTVFENNIAHSIAGYGFIALPSGRGGDCTEVSFLKGYKNKLATVAATNKELRCHDLVTVGSGFGIACMGQGGGDVKVYDSTIYGDKDDPNEDFGNCFGSIGILMSTFGGHAAKAPKVSKWPKMMSGGGAHGTSLYENIVFIGLDGKTKCGKRQVAIQTNHLHSDYHPYGEFRFMEFRDTSKENIIHMSSPSPGWANPDDCGPFTCTGLYNTIAKFDRTSYTGSPNALGLPTTFQVIPDNKESVSSQVIPFCSPMKKEWNGFICENDNLGILLIDSRDPDRMTRNQQPLYVQDSPLGEEPEYNNRLNAYMDHCWDGMYTCQTREQKFPSLVDQDRDYRIEYTGTPAKKQTVQLFGDTGSEPFKVTIWYPDAGAYTIYNRNQELIPPNDWDYETETWGEVTGRKGCGENRYEGVKNRLQFWITPGCTLFIQDRDAVMLAIRLEFTMGEFFEEGGIGTFTNRMAAALGIQAADLKVVQAFEGSTAIEFQVFDQTTDPTPVPMEEPERPTLRPEGEEEADGRRRLSFEDWARSLEETFKEQMESLPATFFGAPIMSYSVGGVGGVTVVLPGFQEPIIEESTDPEQPRVQEVIQVKRIYVTADDINHGHLGTNIVIFAVAFLLALVLVGLVWLVWKVFRKDKEVHEKIHENLGQFKKDIGPCDDSDVLPSQRSVKPQPQYEPGKTDEFFFKKSRSSVGGDEESDAKNRTRPGFGSRPESQLGEDNLTERQASESSSSKGSKNLLKQEETPAGSADAGPAELAQPEQQRNSANLAYLQVVGVADLNESSQQLTIPGDKPASGRKSVSAHMQKRHSSPYLKTQKLAGQTKGAEKRGSSKQHNAFL